MAEGLSAAYANKFLDFIGNATSAGTAPANIYIQLHTAAPGAAGTTAVAGNSLRKGPLSFGAAASGLMSNDVAILWTTGQVTANEDYTHWTLWDAASGGNFIGSGVMTANAVLIGDEFTIPIGDLDLSFNTAT
jgi:hypothetical protein